MQDKNNLIHPKKLKKGDHVGIVAPAGLVNVAELKKGIEIFKRNGLRPVLGKHVFAKNKYFAGTDEERAEDLMGMFEHPDIKAIVCARGGYGVNRILHFLSARTIRRNPKIVVGTSDITILLIYLMQKCSLVPFHGPMVAGNFGRHPMKKTKRQFFDLLSGKSEGKKLTSSQARIINPGVARGPVTGGCLSILCRSLGTPYEIQTDGKILVVEDVNEAPYKIDGMLWHLKNAGKFKKVKGIIFGEMVKCQTPKKFSYTLEDILRDSTGDLSVPILMNFPVGHGEEMWTLPFGVEATLDADSKTLRLKSCGVV